MVLVLLLLFVVIILIWFELFCCNVFVVFFKFWIDVWEMMSRLFCVVICFIFVNVDVEFGLFVFWVYVVEDKVIVIV